MAGAGVIPAGQRDRLITFEAIAAGEDDYGGASGPSPVTIARAWAKVMFGTGQERREAAQERSQQAATFLTNWSPSLATVKMTHRIRALGQVWDITSIAPKGVNDELHFTAVTSA